MTKPGCSTPLTVAYPCVYGTAGQKMDAPCIPFQFGGIYKLPKVWIDYYIQIYAQSYTSYSERLPSVRVLMTKNTCLHRPTFKLKGLKLDKILPVAYLLVVSTQLKDY